MALTPKIIYERQHLSVEYDLVWIVDGFAPTEKAAFHSLSVDTGKRLQTEGIAINVSNCPSRRVLSATFDDMKRAALAGAKFPIHFFCHGVRALPSKKFVGLKMGNDLVRWSELTAPLAEINSCMNGDLILIMTVCGGLSGTKAAVIKPYPFFGLFGPNRPINVGQALRINEEFYQRWFKGEHLNRIVESVNQTLGKAVVFSLSAEGYQKIRDSK